MNSAYEFTGKERDSETGLDYFGARYMASNMGRFLSPDDFHNDTHVADPQSWNLYAYGRNNPLRYVDPTGQAATVSTQCSQDGKTCQVNVTATIAIYAQDSSITQKQMDAAAAKMTSDINSAWSGTYTDNGVTYNVSTSVSVSVVSNENAGVKSGAQNVVGIALNAPNNEIGANTRGGPDRGVLNLTDVMNTPVASHEFTHVLGVDDKKGRNLSNSSMIDGGWTTTGKATQQDFRWALNPTTSNSSWFGKGGTKNPDGSRTVGPPFVHEPWWK